MSIFRRTKKDKKEKKDAWAEEYRAMNGVEEDIEADKKKADEELEAEAKAALKEQEKAEKKQQAQVQAQIQAQNDTVVAIKAFVEMTSKFLSELGKKAGVELPGINTVEIKDETKVDAEIKADEEAVKDTEVAVAKASSDASVGSEAKTEDKSKGNKSKGEKANETKKMIICEEYRARDFKTGDLVTMGSRKEAMAFSSEVYEVKVWKKKDGSTKMLSANELLERYSLSEYPGVRDAWAFEISGSLKVLPSIYLAMQAVKFEKSKLTLRRVEYNEKGEFVRFVDTPAATA